MKKNGQQLRNKGIKRILAHNGSWVKACISVFRSWVHLTAPYEFTGEDIRIVCEIKSLFQSVIQLIK